MVWSNTCLCWSRYAYIGQKYQYCLHRKNSWQSCDERNSGEENLTRCDWPGKTLPAQGSPYPREKKQPQKQAHRGARRFCLEWWKSFGGTFGGPVVKYPPCVAGDMDVRSHMPCCNQVLGCDYWTLEFWSLHTTTREFTTEESVCHSEISLMLQLPPNTAKFKKRFWN